MVLRPAKASSHSPRCTAWTALGKSGVRSVGPSTRQPQKWSKCRWVSATIVIASGATPAAASEPRSVCSLSMPYMVRSRGEKRSPNPASSSTSSRPIFRSRQLHDRRMRLCSSAVAARCHRALGTKPNMVPPSRRKSPPGRCTASASPRSRVCIRCGRGLGRPRWQIGSASRAGPLGPCLCAAWRGVQPGNRT